MFIALGIVKAALWAAFLWVTVLLRQPNAAKKTLLNPLHGAALRKSNFRPLTADNFGRRISLSVCN